MCSTLRFKMHMRMHKKRVFLLLFISYILILTIPLVSGTIFFKKIINVVEENANKSNVAMLEQLKVDIDSMINEVDKLSNQIIFHPKIDTLLDIGMDYPVGDRFSFFNFTNDLAVLRGGGGSILNYFIYLSNSGTVLAPNMKANPHNLYEIYGYNDYTYEDWHEEILMKYHMKEFLPSMQLKNSDTEMNVITYLQSLPFADKENINGQLVILIDDENIKKFISNMQLLGEGSVYIIDDQNNVIVTNDDKHDAVFRTIDGITRDKEVSIASVNGEKMMISYINSQQANWKYVYMVSYDAFMKNVNNIKFVAILILTICVIGGILASYLLAYKNYNPLGDLVNTILNGRNSKSDSYKNEYELIKQSIIGYRNQEKNLENIIDSQSGIVKANFLNRLVKGFISDSQIDKGLWEFMGINVPYELFCIALVKIERNSEFICKDTEQEWALARFATSNIAEELIGKNGVAYLTEMDKDTLVLLINYSDKAELNSEKYIIEGFECLIDTLAAKMQIFVTVGVSDLLRSKDKIHECYVQACQALDYKLIKGQCSVICFNEVCGIEEYYYYPIETEIQLMNLTRSGDIDGINNVLDKIFDTNFKHRKLSLEIGKCLYFNIMSTLIKIMSTLNFSFENVFGQNADPIKAFIECSDIEKMQDMAKKIYAELSEFIRSVQCSNSDKLIERATEYIDKYYDDINLSLNSISDKIGVTPQYLSTIFKKQSGKNISEYITRVRVETVKKLLLDDKLTLSQIAQMVGYSDSNVLIKIFKKMEGVTPGKYREN